MERRNCAHHPDRLAIGVCVETGIPICGECSTRYNGVNYSREGLAILHKRMQAQAAAAKPRVGWAGLLLSCFISLCVCTVGYWLAGWFLMSILGRV